MTDVLSGVTSWLYHLGDISNADMATIADTSSELVVIEWANYSDEERPYTSDDLATMRGDMDDRLMVSYLSIGEAEDYRFYWNTPEFQAIRNQVVDNENPEWEGNYKARYWLDDWQDVIFDYVDKIVDAGFNGVYLDIIDAFEYWQEKAPNAGIDYAGEMANFVAAIKAHADDRLAVVDPGREFVIIGQNGESLLDNQTYLSAIDGVGKEDLRFYSELDDPTTSLQGKADYQWSLGQLLKAEAAGVDVFVIEYLSGADQKSYSTALEALKEALAADGIVLYLSETRDFQDITPPLEGAEPQPTSGADTLAGSSAADTVDLLAGDDAYWAHGGNDDVKGGDGRDTLGGGTGNDMLEGGAGNDTIYGAAGDDQVSGGSGNDLLFNGEGKDTVFGGAGDDTIWSGRGGDGDTLTGGDGRDRFIFVEDTGDDIVTDFRVADDTLDFSALAAFADVDSVVAVATATTVNGSAGVMIDLGAGSSLFLVGLTLGEIPSIDFVF